MRVGETDLEVVAADITALNVDAIVNAANRTPAGGGGADGCCFSLVSAELRRSALEDPDIGDDMPVVNRRISL